MPRVALGQLNLTVGDLDGNVERMVQASREAAAAGAEVVCFPELAITGYPPEDLVLRPEFVRDNLAALEDLAARTAETCPAIVGFVDPTERGLHNASAFLSGGAVRTRYHKLVLPNYGVFDEQRYFVAGERTEQVSVGGISVGLTVCEDAWHAGRPFSDYRGVSVVVNINGSPYHRRKLDQRLGVLSDRAREFGGWIAYVNAVGGQDELVFDGGSLLMGPDGEVACRAAMFEEQVLVVDVADDTARVVGGPEATWPKDPEAVYRALVLGLRDYVRKNGFRDVVLGLSGGVDSAFVAVLAADALGPDAVRAIAMPSPYSSSESLEDAGAVAGALGIRLDVVGIEGPFQAYRSALRPLFDDRPEDVTEENLQARIRGNYLMAVSNKSGSLVLATGNKSEYAVGYATLYGDMAGGFAPIKDVPKTLVYELCRWRNATGPGSPLVDRVLSKPPSAELRPGQKDTDSLPPYDELDPIVEAYVEDDLGLDEIVARGHDPATVERVTRLIDRAEYKRRQAAPGIKITPKAFGRDRRMPITNRYVDERTSAPGPVS